jgi:hypothetical protein
MIPPAEAEEITSQQQAPPPVPSSASSSESPFLRRLDSFRRSSTEFSISSFRQTYSNSTNGGGNNSGASTNNPDFDNDLGSDPSMDPLAVKQSSSSESQAFYGNEDVVKDLKPEYARWFYKYEPDRAWTPFTGYDSIRMEQRYRNLMLEREALYGNNMSRGQINEDDGYDYSGDSNGYYYNNHHQYHQYPAYSHQQYCHNNEYLEQQYQEGQMNECVDALGNLSYQQTNQYHDQHYHPQPDSYYNNFYAPPPQQPHPQQNFTHIPPTSSPRFDNCTAKNNQQPEGIPPPAVDEESMEEKRKNGEETFGENVIIVRGGLYEADLENWTCVATYWPG